MAETSPGPEDPDELEPFEPVPEEPKPDDPKPDDPDPDRDPPDPEPFDDGGVAVEDEAETEFELLVQATWPMPAPAARATTAAAPMTAAMRRRLPVGRGEPGWGAATQLGGPELGGGPP